MTKEKTTKRTPAKPKPLKKSTVNALNGLVLNELTSYPRFRMWVEANYQVHVFKNDTTKRVEVKVIEEDMYLANQKLSAAVQAELKLRESNESRIQVVSPAVMANLTKH